MKLIIHIGYPKTATTTLQQFLFQELHNKKVNFVWRDNENKEIFDYILLGKKKKNIFF